MTIDTPYSLVSNQPLNTLGYGIKRDDTLFYTNLRANTTLFYTNLRANTTLFYTNLKANTTLFYTNLRANTTLFYTNLKTNTTLFYTNIRANTTIKLKDSLVRRTGVRRSIRGRNASYEERRRLGDVSMHKRDERKEGVSI